MTPAAQEHLRQLDLEPGCRIDEVRKAFRTLSFIWHPDRQPEQYVDLAQAKLQRINDAHEFFSSQPEALDTEGICEALESKPETHTGNYKVHKASCVRCQGSGLVASEVGSKGEFEHSECEVCRGTGQVVVDDRNLCKCCMGEGLNPKLSPEDRESWIETEMLSRGWFDRHLNPLEYKRLWLRYHQEHMVCSSCHGSGYFFYKPDERKNERRQDSAADFLRDLVEDFDGRQKDRRKA